MGAADEILTGNEAYAEAFDKGDLPAAPAKRLIVLACMDARMDVHRILGLAEGDAQVLRNPGGVVTDDEIRAFAISQRKFGTEEIVLIQHTGCGVQGFDDEDFRRQVWSETGIRPEWDSIGFRDLERSVRDGIARLRASPFIRNDTRIHGFVYDVGTGRLHEVPPH